MSNWSSSISMMSEPNFQTTRQWRITGHNGFEGLRFSDEPVPEIRDHDVLVMIRGASLNFRDVLIPLGRYPFPHATNVVPGSDGAGTVLAVGRSVTRFQPGDKVITTLFQKYPAGSLTTSAAESSLGGSRDGTLRTIGSFDEQGLVKMPQGLSFIEAATLSCTGVTAWNALFGQPGRELRAGQWILTQGTGGVSVYAIQFAKVAGAGVIATTSSKDKAKLLERLGADHIINYRETTNWGEKAKLLTGGIGVDLVVEVAGSATIQQSVASLKLDGTISVVGFIGGDDKGGEIPNLLDPWLKHYTVRGISVGNLQQMEAMCHAVEVNIEKLRPVLDSKIFTLEEVKAAYKYLEAQKNLGKVCIEIS